MKTYLIEREGLTVGRFSIKEDRDNALRTYGGIAKEVDDGKEN